MSIRSMKCWWSVLVTVFMLMLMLLQVVLMVGDVDGVGVDEVFCR